MHAVCMRCTRTVNQLNAVTHPHRHPQPLAVCSLHRTRYTLLRRVVEVDDLQPDAPDQHVLHVQRPKLVPPKPRQPLALHVRERHEPFDRLQGQGAAGVGMRTAKPPQAHLLAFWNREDKRAQRGLGEAQTADGRAPREAWVPGFATCVCRALPEILLHGRQREELTDGSERGEAAHVRGGVKTHDVESVTGEREQRDGLLLRKIHWVCVCPSSRWRQNSGRT